MTAPKANPTKHVYDVVVVKVIDGDTIAGSILLRKSRTKEADLGFHIYVEKGMLVLHDSIRFFGINANEHGTPEGDKATAFLKTLIKPGDVLRIATKVAAGRDSKEKYGRWLGTIWRLGDQTSINDQMVAAGHAKPWDGQGARPLTGGTA